MNEYNEYKILRYEPPAKSVDATKAFAGLAKKQRAVPLRDGTLSL